MVTIGKGTFFNAMTPVWRKTTGDPAINVAVLDGHIDLGHPAFAGAKIIPFDGVPARPSSHGTAVASLIVGQHDSATPGMAPAVTLLSFALYPALSPNGPAVTDQVSLARAITRAIEAGAHIINISAGQLDSSGEPVSILQNALRFALERNVLIVASVGNNGCDCVHVPAASPSVLAIGAANQYGDPLPFSNWGGRYAHNGLLFPGSDLNVAAPNRSSNTVSGSSFATAIASGFIGLMLKLQLDNCGEVNPLLIRDVLLRTATPCHFESDSDCQRFLHGYIDVESAASIIEKDNFHVRSTEAKLNNLGISESSAEPNAARVPTMATTEAGISPAGEGACGCSTAGTNSAPHLTYAIGQLGWDYGTEARRDSLVQAMGAVSIFDPIQVMNFIDANPEFDASLIWTLNQESTPIYAIAPHGPHALRISEELRKAYRNQIDQQVAAERVALSGYSYGQTRLFNGQLVPALVPDLRGFFQWTTGAMLSKLTEGLKEKAADDRSVHIRNFLDRVYYELSNLGISSQDRALNFAATNAFQYQFIAERAILEGKTLDSIDVERSAISRPGSDCWDIVVKFFDPANRQEIARKAYRFTVDVSEVIPVTIGTVRSWSVY